MAGQRVMGTKHVTRISQRGRSRVAVAAPLVLVVAVAFGIQSAPDPAAAAAWHAPKPKDVTGIKVSPVVPPKRPNHQAAAREFTATEVQKARAIAGEHIVDVTSATAAAADDATAARSRGVQAGDLPVYVGKAKARAGAKPSAEGPTIRQGRSAALSASKVRVKVLDPAATTKAGITGVAMQLSRADGARTDAPTTVSVDYGALGGTFSGDASGRLRMIDVSDGRPIPSENDADARTVTATVMLPATGSVTVGLAAGPEGATGDYKATSLSSASTWQVSQQTGAFAWSYPIKAPAGVGSLKPSLALSYNSADIDGRTSGTNTQGSWVGDGWSLWPGFIERSYRACSDDKDVKEKKDPNNADAVGGDLCYFDDNATVSLNGRAAELVKVASSDAGPNDKNIEYRGVSDDGAKIEMIRDGRANGDVDGTYWVETTTDGTKYYFGRSSGEGGSSAGAKTNSVFSAPVYSNHPDDPGYDKDFAKSRNTRGWRWNLDYVVDPSGNTMTYYYDKEVGAYAREGDQDKRTTYERGGYLTSIEYGSRADHPASVHPAAKVLFKTADRCVGACFGDDKKPIAAAFPDTPWDQYCPEAPCKTQFAPTFWTQKRLAEIRTQVYSGTGEAYIDVDSWSLDHKYLSATVNQGSPLWLSSIVHKGLVTSAGGSQVEDPPVVFEANADSMPNRVDTSTDGHSSLARSRIQVITTESGAQIGVTYSGLECTRSSLPDPWDNTKRCFPQYYGAEGETPKLDWFHKYVVTRLDVYDATGGSGHEQTNYDYLDKPAWAYDESKLIKPKKRTWGQFRGYGQVQVRQGLESDVQSATEYRYFRGMDGDKQPNAKGEMPPTGTPRSVAVEDSLKAKIVDHESFAGFLRETIVYNGPGGDWISGVLNTPGHLDATAQDGSLRAWPTHTKQTRNRTHLSNGGTRWKSSETTFDPFNYPAQVNDVGDESIGDDDRCITTEYTRNVGAWILGSVKRTEVLGTKCGATRSNADVLGDTRIWYDDPDDADYGKEPTRGLPVRVDELDSWKGTSPQFVNTSKTGYDEVGRVKSVADALGHTTKTDYTPDTAGPVTKTVATDAMNNTASSSIDPALGLPVRATDDGNQTFTEMTYDGAGRLQAVWAPGHTKAANPTSPDATFEYHLHNDSPSTVMTKVLTGYGSNTYRTSVTLLDGLLRTRQTQTQTDNGGRAITDTVYDSRGLVDWVSVPYYDLTNAAPSTTLVSPDGRPEAPASTQNVYDGAGRLTDAIFQLSGKKKWSTHTAYAGEKTSVTPPVGGTATTAIIDAHGRTVELRQYKDPKNVGSDTVATFDKATYKYNKRGLLDTVVDPGKNYWSYEYDLHGRTEMANDPDAGSTKSSYYANGQLKTTTDHAGHVLAYSYDPLGRKKAEFHDEVGGPLAAEWVYDDTRVNGKGKLSRSVRYDPAGSANAFVKGIAGYDTGGRPTGVTVTVPPTESGLCAGAADTPCSYTVGQSYRPNGDPYRTKYAAIAGLPQESVEVSYDSSGLVDGVFGILTAGNQIYADNTWNQLDGLIGQTLGQFGNEVHLVTGIDEYTGRRSSFRATPSGKADIYNLGYHYDEAGNVHDITDKPDGGQTAETQCFAYDYLRRITEAWTPTSLTCQAAPTVPGLGGAAKYWQSFTFDAAGNRKTEVLHGVTDTKRTYTYPASGGAVGTKPHAVTQVVTTTGAANTVLKTETYAYNKTGATVCRPAGAVSNTCPVGATAGKDNQALTWDREHHLVNTTDKSGETTYVYDADGSRLIRRDPTGSTLYLPGGTELRKPKTTAAAATRYYAVSGNTVAVRTSAGLTWLVNDHHGTGSATVSNDGKMTVNRQRTFPFGTNRGSSPAAWAGDKGFVGGTKDNTGLTHLGAREYDPTLGRFVSVDPLMDLADPTQWNGYGYANNNPVVASDPSGLSCRPSRDSPCGLKPPKEGGSKAPPPAPEEEDDEPIGTNDGDVVQGADNSSVCVVGYICIDGRHITDPASFIHDYYAELARLRAISGKDDLDPAQYALAMLRGCGVGRAGNCSSSAFRDLQSNLTRELGPIMEKRHPNSLAKGAVAAGLTVISGVSGCDLRGMISGGRRSFAADTRVLLDDGTTKKIKDIKVGDHVVATDPERGEQGSRSITHVWVHDDDLYTLRVNGKKLVTTEDHPFWNATDSRWERADQLDRGDLLLTPAGRGVRVDGFTEAPRGKGMAYNLTVDDIHTYYVMAGTTPVLVHNEDGGMVGANGTQITSSTVWLRGSYRIDVENPNPGVRPGQLHFQDQATGAKYLYNHDTGQFEGMPNSLQKELDKKMPDYKKAIVKGNRFLGMGGC